MNVVVNILRGHLVDADQEIPVEQIEVKDGELFVAGQRHEVVFIGDHRNEFIGLGFTPEGEPRILSRCYDEEFLWHWGDVMLAPVISTKEVPA